MVIWADSEAWRCMFGQKKTLYSGKSYRNNFRKLSVLTEFSDDIEHEF